MATTKSTVVGIRLDHDRRAWVEAEAARLGVSVRGLFEGMIDEARAAETDVRPPGTVDAAPAGVEPTPESPVPDLPVHTAGSRGEDAARQTSKERAEPADGAVTSESSTAPKRPSGPSLWPDLGPVTGVPTGLVRRACALTAVLIESSAQCATKRLGLRALTRHRGDDWV